MRRVDRVLHSFRHKRCGLGLVAALVLMAHGCGDGGGGNPAPLRVAAASDLQSAMPALIKRFEQNTGIKTTFTPGASGQLAEQIKNGAPFDIFLAANESFVRDLAGQGLIKPDSVYPYARGSLVLAVYQEQAGQIRSLEDLAKPAVKRIALAQPATAPYGKAGKQALERAGMWKRLEPKIVLAESVRQALMYVQKGDAEAALIGRAIARVPEIRVVEIDAQLYDPIIQALGVVAATSRPAEAESFARFVLGDEGQSILTDFGLSRAGSAPSPADAGPKRLPARSQNSSAAQKSSAR
jgi:molybdate transport system substrate-binding protein